MINIPSILTSNGIGLFMLISLLYNLRKRKMLNISTDGIFTLMLIINIAQCIIEPFSFIITDKIFPGCRTIAIIANSLLFINTTLFSYTWVYYFCHKIFNDKARIRRMCHYFMIPGAIIILSVIINVFTPLYFIISPSNAYIRFTYYSIPYAVTYFYLIYGVVLSFKYRDKFGNYIFLPAVFFLIPVIIGSALQYFFYGFSFIWSGTAIGLTCLYINLQNEISSTDPLSGLFTRQYMNGYLESALTSNTGDRKVVGIMLDIDKFKNINDNFGHLTGDGAIRKAGDILRESIGDTGIAARFAGDEFIAIIKVTDESKVKNLINTIIRKTEQFNASKREKYQLNFSIGYGVYNQGVDTIESFLGRIDSEMYLQKRRKSTSLDEK